MSAPKLGHTVSLLCVLLYSKYTAATQSVEKLSFWINFLTYWWLRKRKGRLRLVRDNSLISSVSIVTLQCGHFVYWLGIIWLHVSNGTSLIGKDWRFLKTVFSRVDVVGAVADSRLGGIGDSQYSVSLWGPRHRLRTCIIQVKILGKTNSKPGVPGQGPYWFNKTGTRCMLQDWNNDPTFLTVAPGQEKIGLILAREKGIQAKFGSFDVWQLQIYCPWEG